MTKVVVSQFLFIILVDEKLSAETIVFCESNIWSMKENDGPMKSELSPKNVQDG